MAKFRSSDPLVVTLNWQRVHLQARAGWIDIVGKGDKRRRLPLNVEARKALEAIQPTPPADAADAVFRGKRGPYSARGIEYLVAELGRLANVPNVHSHCFRHDAARRLVESVDLPWDYVRFHFVHFDQSWCARMFLEAGSPGIWPPRP